MSKRSENSLQGSGSRRWVGLIMLSLGLSLIIVDATIVSVAVPGALFALFEIWFLLPLPKGPIEALFGY